MMGTCSKVIVILGATATGKSEAAHSLYRKIQEQFDIEPVLVNLDAFQFFRGFDIGTSKPSPTEQNKYQYQGLDILEPTQTLDASRYVTLMDQLIGTRPVAICVGGSGLYSRAFLHGLDDMPARDEELRQFLRGISDHWGWPRVHRWLTSLDPVRASALHPNDGVRIERALECCLVAGTPVSQIHSNASVALENQLLRREILVLQTSATNLRNRIEVRVQQMLNNGWEQEVETQLKLHVNRFIDVDFATIPAMRSIGYLQIYQCMQGLFPKELLHTIICQKTWQYAKRQQTWNRKEVNHGSPHDWDLVDRYLKNQT
jgi:tRNA dimethylallyltransferase